MKKISFFLTVILSALFLSSSSVLAEEILNFHSDISIQKDSTLLVKETIVYDFGDLQKHGIYRDIPLGNTLINVQKVLDENNTPYKYTTLRQGQNLEIKIGDADYTITGLHTYNIFYSVKNDLRFFDDHDELYQNVTGNDWQVPIESSSAKVILPQNISESDLQLVCFTGVYGSKTSECNWQLDNQGNIIFESTRGFSVGEGLTIVLGWPKGIVKENSMSIWIFRFEKFWPFLIPFFVTIFLFIYWWKNGKDMPLKGPVIAQYGPPDDLKPAQIGAIMHQDLRPVDISATIIDWAVRGYIKIKEIKNKPFDVFLGVSKSIDYELIILKNLEEGSNPYEKKLWEEIFIATKVSPKMSEVNFRMYVWYKKIRKEIAAEMSLMGYFVRDFSKRFWPFFKLNYFRLYVFILAFLFPFFVSIAVFLKTEPLIMVIAIFMVPIIFAIFSGFMPKRTQKGADAYWKILGFKEYIETAEKYRIQFQEKEDTFEKFLPYAMVFGLSQKWAKAFEGIYNHFPSWYEGSYVGTFSIISFNKTLGSAFFGTTNGSFSGGSGFGGGGFSGGGGGGGGGGSW
jgi:uncharacterized membrane protein